MKKFLLVIAALFILLICSVAYLLNFKDQPN